MGKNSKGIVGLFLLVVLLLAATGCEINPVKVGTLLSEREVVELGAAQEVTAEINMGAGRLAIDGGSDNLLEAQFTYNVEAWKPVITYDVSDGVGRLKVDQPDSREVPLDLGDIRYEWDLRFNEFVPLDMEIALGAGDSELELDSLTLNSLVFEGGAGDVMIDLSGSTLRDLDVRMGAGDVTVDLSGNWQQDLAADLKGGLGRATVFLPNDVGILVTVQGGLGQINAAGLNKDGDVYTNDAYGQSEVTLEIDIEGGVGEINLEMSG